AVLKGSFDKFAEGTKGKKGTANVDDAFLEEIERWRDMLARNIAMRNEKLSQRELNFSVQRIIDRIIFLRICEDRGIEPYGRLMTLRNGERAYPRLCEFFQRADERYNSGLFHFQREKDRPEAPDELTLSLKIDDTVLKDIVGNLYYPESPYEFSVLPADILGQVYERFLGKVIRLTAGHQAKVEDKPEVRKAGGVYYTPTYIVDYIVKNTVGKLLEGKTPRQTAKLKILDPACGSGSFLLGAYQLLLDWHLVQYMKKPENWTKGREPKLYQHHKGGWKLTTAERKRILLNNIYGVDIDSQAVEVTKLSLLLKVLEGESQETITKQFELFHQRALPDLGSNIKCGNSLIGPDFYKDRQGELFGEDEMFRINIFDWNAEFSEIMKNGGFDTVIGNPPYLNVDDTWGKGDSRLAALKKLYSNIYNDKTDILFYFLGKAIQLSKGYICFIVSRAFLEAYKADKLRTYLLLQSSIQEVIDFRNFHVFYGVGITTCIITLRRNSKPGIIQAYKLLIDVLPSGDLQILRSNPQIFEQIEISQNSLCSSAWVMVSSTVSGLNEKIDRMGDPLNKILIIGQGMQTGQNDVFGKRTLKEVTQWRLKPGQFYKRASNSDIQRYFIQDRGEYIFYPQIFTNIEQLPKGVQKHLLANVVELKGRAA
ncbi:MAG: BREX-1 system adenine-specific DNA-methyltransferase PglX, partial [Kiritimatiellae bacterium]|nr:BREX-1 system adenine-specific DNA-methyltransferase PglX [Kiritimatiellia bacterium]